jgi:hypothetical protein
MIGAAYLLQSVHYFRRAVPLVEKNSVIHEAGTAPIAPMRRQENEMKSGQALLILSFTHFAKRT